jgi:signal transduction histidine kinase
MTHGVDHEHPGGRPRFSVRARVLASVVAMSLLGILVAGLTAYVVQVRIIDASVTDALEQEVEEFRALAADGVDPETGQRFTSIEQLLRVALQRNVPHENETYLTFVDGVPFEYDGGDRPIRLEEEPTVLAEVGTVAAGSAVAIRDVQTSDGQARLAVVPVSVAGSEAFGTYVIAVAVDRERAELTDLIRLYAVVALGSLVLVALVGWLVAGRLLAPLHDLRESAQRISETDLTERIPVRGNDDVSDLTRTYNAMLDRLQGAFDTQRGLLDDAGHELRTPVTILRGHLELLDPTDPQEVRETRDLLLDEVDRMARLVDDLILLAKARRPDFVVLGEVDLGSLTDDVLVKAQGLADRPWRLDARATGRLSGDEQRLTQAMLQLADNAAKYSVPGSPIHVGSALHDGKVRLWVRDEGPGIDAAELDRIFERFGRGPAGNQVEGTGLGLAIVTAIATAHGGRVEVQSAAGSGSTFTLVLPRTAP